MTTSPSLPLPLLLWTLIVVELRSYFKLRDLGETSYLLGIEISCDWDKKTISICQKRYILDVLKRFNMENCNSVKTPMAPGNVLTKDMAPKMSEVINYMASVPYLSAVGALNYLSPP